MKRICLFLVVAVVQIEPVQAQRFGDGRFIRRMFGVEEPAPPQPYQRQSAEAAQEALKQQAAVKKQALLKEQESLRQQKSALQQKYLQSQGRLPAPSAAQQRLNGNGRQIPSAAQSPRTPRPADPSLQQRYGYRPFDESSKKTTKRSKQPTPARSTVNRSRTTENPFARQDPRSAKSPAPKSTGTVDGFGLTLRMNGKQAMVTRVAKASTAAEAGLKQGDLIKTIGSLPIESVNDAEQFAEVLKPGDQLEFEIVRRGKDSKMLVSFIRVAEENLDVNVDSESEGIVAPGDFDAREKFVSSKSKADEFKFSAEPTTRVNTRSTQSILSKSDLDLNGKSEVQELREVVAMQKQIISGLQQRLNKLEQATDAVPELNFPR